jgi:hypothetical protein
VVREPNTDLLAFQPLLIDELRRLVAPPRALLRPVSAGLEGVPREGPVLFTRNPRYASSASGVGRDPTGPRRRRLPRD